MNLRSPIFIGLLAAGLVVQTAGTIAQEAQSVPSEIVLNGIMANADAKRAFFRAAFTFGAAKADFALAEGETRYGIQLLAVDARLNAVKIRNHGLVQTIPICQTPEIVWSGTPVNATGKPRLMATAPQNNRPVQTGDSPDEANTIAPSADFAAVAGVPGFAAAAGMHGSVNSGNTPPTAGDGTPSTTDAASENSNDSTSTSQGHRYQWWIQEAQKIEQARIETAERVMAGEWQPYPLTPLTPPGTSPELIGPSSAFMEHGPGVIVAGS
jgi:hypothetical protein